MISTPLHFYEHSGLTIASDILVPEWEGFETRPRGLVDVAVRVRPHVEIDASHADSDSYADDQICRFVVPKAGRFSITREEIAVDLFDDADLGLVRLFVLGSAWGALCHLRGLLIIHAGVVRIGNGAVAFCGESGAGKSSMAAWLSGEGYSVVVDDLCRLHIPEDGMPIVYSSTHRIKLWREAIEALGWTGRESARDYARAEKYHCPLNNREMMRSLPLLGIFILMWGDCRVTRLAGLSALQRIVGAMSYRGELLQPTGRLAGYWRDCAEIVRRVPIWELSRPRDWAAISDVWSLIEREIAPVTDRGSIQQNA